MLYEVITKYGAYGEKMMYGKKTTGVIRSTVWIGPDGKVKKPATSVTVVSTTPPAMAGSIFIAIRMLGRRLPEMAATSRLMIIAQAMTTPSVTSLNAKAATTRNNFV